MQLAKLPELQELRNGLYSPEFRKAVEEMTGCGSLNARTDMSANVYSRGHHLLCHDDVIGTRRVSFIVYLTEPDEPWKAEVLRYSMALLLLFMALRLFAWLAVRCFTEERSLSLSLSHTHTYTHKHKPREARSSNDDSMI